MGDLHLPDAEVLMKNDLGDLDGVLPISELRTAGDCFSAGDKLIRRHATFRIRAMESPTQLREVDS